MSTHTEDKAGLPESEWKPWHLAGREGTREFADAWIVFPDRPDRLYFRAKLPGVQRWLWLQPNTEHAEIARAVCESDARRLVKPLQILARFSPEPFERVRIDLYAYAHALHAALRSRFAGDVNLKTRALNELFALATEKPDVPKFGPLMRLAIEHLESDEFAPQISAFFAPR